MWLISLFMLGDDIEHARTTYHKTCGTKYQQSYRRFNSQTPYYKWNISQARLMSVSHVSRSLQNWVLTSWSNFLLTIIDFEHYIILLQQSCWLLLFTLNIIILAQLWVASEKAQRSSGHMRRKRPYPSEVMEICLIVLRVVACPACWCRGKTLPSPSK